MNNFEFASPTKIVFGKGTEKEVGRHVAEHAGSVLIHYGSDRIKKDGLFDTVTESLKAAGVEYTELGGVKPNPRLGLVREGIELCKKKKIDFILAVGGGSVIDSAKGIAAGVLYDGDLWDVYIGKAAPPTQALPVGVVLTIPAAGSEASKFTVLTTEDGWYKRAFNSEILRPKFAVMNPELTFSLPPYQTASGIADIMAHIMERYFTNVEKVDLTDRLCEAAMRSVIANAPVVMETPDNYDARAEIMWASTLAHNDLLSTGRVGDFGSHQIEHELSGIYDVAHGAGLAVIFPAWMKYVYKQNVSRFVQFAVRVWNVDERFDDPERTALEGIARMEAFLRSISMPVTLEELGIPTADEKLDEIAAKTFEERGSGVGNFVKLLEKDVRKILELAKA
ncbi:iron-containing alcohol dehydrogenase [Marispirochaeta aestuarii]|uniref:iron-containing alcohol dehydrogenase n=1 Tax=Marispirochaeta aestuarii TaxID=1963862 RepID=UPI002ABDD580|nr:iron-containing alcohol dehydrogenase [Marispirochaeta aestuarii]